MVDFPLVLRGNLASVLCKKSAWCWGLCAMGLAACSPDLGRFDHGPLLFDVASTDAGSESETAVTDGGMPGIDGGNAVDTGFVSDDVPPGADTGVSGTDVPVGIDSGPPPVDVPIVVDTAPPPVDVPIVVDTAPPPVDVAPPPTDSGPPCGAAGQGCCASNACATGLSCTSWGTTQICGRCGGQGDPCCTGSTCTGSGASCQSLIAGALNVCTAGATTDNTPGGACNALRTGTTCGTADTACVPGNRIGQATCAACGYIGGPCCYGEHCDAGDSHCLGPYGGIYVCR